MAGVNGEVTGGNSLRAVASGFTISKSYNTSSGMLSISGTTQRVYVNNNSGAGVQSEVVFAYLITGEINHNFSY